jgi:hypothetical protein
VTRVFAEAKIVVVARNRPDFLETHCEKLSRDGEQRWRNRKGDRLYTWDALHGHIEVFNSRGRHLGVLEAQTGQLIGPPVPGRRIDV